jgi:hypothetical protein
MTTQNPADTPLHASTLSNAEFSTLEEAARYALLQRISPALQHHLMGKFQSMSVISSMMERRILSATPDYASIRADCSSLGSVSRLTVDSILNIMSWVEPKKTATVKFGAGVGECVGLLATELRFKGFDLVNEVPDIDVELSSRALRTVLSATLIALSDLAGAPAQIVLRAKALPNRVELSISLHPRQGSKNTYVSDYRALQRRDAEILALAESVQLTLGEDSAQLVFACPDTPAVAETLDQAQSWNGLAKW